MRRTQRDQDHCGNSDTVGRKTRLVGEFNVDHNSSIFLKIKDTKYRDDFFVLRFHNDLKFIHSASTKNCQILNGEGSNASSI